MLNVMQLDERLSVEVVVVVVTEPVGAAVPLAVFLSNPRSARALSLKLRLILRI